MKNAILFLLLMGAAFAQAPMANPNASGGSGGGGGGTPGGPLDALQSNTPLGTFAGSSHLVTCGTLPTPAAPILAISGMGGATTYGYLIVAVNLCSGSVASAPATIATGNAVLSAMNFIVVGPPSCGTGVTGYDVYRSTSMGTPSTTGLIARNLACGSSVNDTGLPFLPPWNFSASTYGNVPGLGSDQALVNTGLTAFGSLAKVDLTSDYPFFDIGTVGVYETATNPDFVNAGQAFTVELMAPNGTAKSPTAQAVDVDYYSTTPLTIVGTSSTVILEPSTSATTVMVHTVTVHQNSGATVAGNSIGYQTDIQSTAAMSQRVIGIDVKVDPNGNSAEEDGLYFEPFSPLSGTSTSVNAIRIASVQAGATTFCAICIDDQTLGGTNFAIKTGLGLVSLGDALTVAGNVSISTGSPLGVVNAAVCWKTTTTLGRCSSVVGAGGTCTCN